jgi:hypothetical protein|tara:strand:- start:52341 stop:53288 length:948 start_codon:yes stop_codon:yes gene_type:complete
MRNARPFLLALAPLLIGLAAYYIYWRGQAEMLATSIERIVGHAPDITGFPYRLSADLNAIQLSRGGDATRVDLSAAHSQIDSGPLRGALYVGYLTQIRINAEAAGIGQLRLTAPDARASLRANEFIDRLSVQFEEVEIDSSLLDRPIQAAPMEFHFRETPNPTPADTATGPGQAEARIAGTFSLADRRLALALPIRITADAPLSSLAGWTNGGTMEIDGGTLSSASGDAVAGFDVTLVPLPGGELQLAGTLSTDCPATVAAVIQGSALPAQEFRQRRPAEFALGGSPTQISLQRLPGPSGGSVRSQEPPCPDLRR